VHAPHAVWAALVLVDEGAAAGGPVRRAPVPMSLTDDGLYWWCVLPADQAPHGTRYRFAFNDDVEVMDPAARWVYDSGDYNTRPGADPRDAGTSGPASSTPPRGGRSSIQSSGTR